MRCEDVNINMLALAEGTLDRETETRLREHIDLCEACKAQLEFFEGVMAQIDSEKVVQATSGFSDRIIASVSEKRKYRSIPMSIFVPIAAAAVIVFGIFMGISISNLTGGSSSEIYADMPDEFYYSNEIHLETIEGFFLTNED